KTFDEFLRRFFMSSSGSPVHGISGRGAPWQITVNTSQSSPRQTHRVKESFLGNSNLKMSDLMDRIGRIVAENLEDPSMPPLNREFEVDPGFYCENAEEFTERKEEITQQYPQISITFGFGMGRTMIYVSRGPVKTSPNSSPKRGASPAVYHIHTHGSAGQTQSAPSSPNPHSGSDSPNMTTGALSVSRSISG